MFTRTSRQRLSRRFTFAGAAALFIVASIIADADTVAAAQITAVQSDSSGVSFTLADGVLRIDCISDRVIHVWRAPSSAAVPPASFAVTARPASSICTTAQSNDATTLSSSAVRITVERATGRITFANSRGALYVAERADGAAFSPSTVLSGSLRVRQAFDNPPSYNGGPSEAFFGLGQHANGLMNLRGAAIRLQQINGDVALPLALSSKGYGLFWDNPAVTDVSVASPGSGGVVFDSEAGAGVNYYFIAGPTPDDVIAGYRALTGAAPMLPRWAWGFWQSKEHYETQQELLDVAQHYRNLGVPLDAVIQDWQYWPRGQWGSHRFDPARFPDPARMMRDLHAMHVHAIISVWPRFDVDTDTGAELDRAGVLFPLTMPNVYPGGIGRWYDAFNAQGRSLYWRQISQRLGVLGWDGYWLDASEAELSGTWGEMRGLHTAAGEGPAVYNAYPLMHTAAIYEGQRRDFPAKRALVLTRSAWAGQQRNAAITWSGDIHGDWETFRRQVPAGLNFVASGIPYWNTDIGGFFGGDPTEANYRELFVRWFQFGAFTPMFRVHGTGPAKEYWRFDAEAQHAMLESIRLRYRLLPYIYATSWRVTADGYTMMRPLVMDFTADPLALSVTDEFMFGPALLISPVTTPRAQSRTVYLPAGATWYDFRSNSTYAGGTTVDAEAPLNHLPIFVRAGSILPIGPDVQYADEQTNAPLQLRIYRGGDGAFTLYDDAGDGYGYEHGQRATIALQWDDAHQILRLGARQGTYPGMARERVFNIVWIDPHGVSAPQRVSYSGRALTLQAPASN
ncbi:MAG: TIM-barrel domain-containing protein [Pseudomonadota bacterium]